MNDKTEAEMKVEFQEGAFCEIYTKPPSYVHLVGRRDHAGEKPCSQLNRFGESENMQESE